MESAILHIFDIQPLSGFDNLGRLAEAMQARRKISKLRFWWRRDLGYQGQNQEILLPGGYANSPTLIRVQMRE